MTIQIDAWGVTALALVQTVLVMWLKSRLEASIKHESDKRFEEWRNEQRLRERAAMVAELFAVWLAHPDSAAMTAPVKERLNRLNWEATIWLPEPLALEVNRRLNNATRVDIRQIILDVRTLLRGEHQMTFDKIVFF